jgi:opacity protein-like surface antigen
MKKIILFFIINIIFSVSNFGQDELFDLLNEPEEEKTDVVIATFKATRIMNGHSIERMQAKQLDFRIHHRFGRLNSGAYDLWGLDQANIHFSLEYGIKDWVMIGVGRGTYEKTYNGFAKFSLLRQSTGKKNIPVSVSYFLSTDIKTIKWSNPDLDYPLSARLAYVHQLLIARKFNEKFSFQLSPSLVHRNLVATELDPNDIFALGAGGRFKLNSRISLNAEYYYVFKPEKEYLNKAVYNPLSIGFDIETGGHVFQLIFTNSVAMIEKGFITETTGDWSKGDIHFGFNISRVFAF